MAMPRVGTKATRTALAFDLTEKPQARTKNHNDIVSMVGQHARTQDRR